MSADNLIRIKKKENGLYRVTYEPASSLIHALNDIEPKEEELTMGVVVDDVDKETARRKAHEYWRELEDDGIEVEYGIVDDNWKK